MPGAGVGWLVGRHSSGTPSRWSSSARAATAGPSATGPSGLPPRGIITSPSGPVIAVTMRSGACFTIFSHSSCRRAIRASGRRPMASHFSAAQLVISAVTGRGSLLIQPSTRRRQARRAPFSSRGWRGQLMRFRPKAWKVGPGWAGTSASSMRRRRNASDVGPRAVARSRYRNSPAEANDCATTASAPGWRGRVSSTQRAKGASQSRSKDDPVCGSTLSYSAANGNREKCCSSVNAA